jgi:hypothetical protein
MASRIASTCGLCRNPRLVAGIAQNRCIRAAVDGNAVERNLEARDPLNAGGKGIEVDAVGVAQQRAIDVKQIGILPIPGKAGLNLDACFGNLWSGLHHFSLISGTGDMPQ